MKFCRIVVALVVLVIFGGCATESSRVVVSQKVNTFNRPYYGEKTSVSIGNFDNKTSYMSGVFSSGKNRLGSQAKTILASSLQQSNRFTLLDRENLAEIKQEASFSKDQQQIRGAKYVITGDVTAFGRKNVGDRQLFGILGRGKKQIAYAKVDLNVVSVASSQLVYSVQGAGEHELSHREIVGFGGTAGYDATLNGKVLHLAIREAVNNLVEDIDNGRWNPAE